MSLEVEKVVHDDSAKKRKKKPRSKERRNGTINGKEGSDGDGDNPIAMFAIQ